MRLGIQPISIAPFHGIQFAGEWHARQPLGKFGSVLVFFVHPLQFLLHLLAGLVLLFDIAEEILRPQEETFAGALVPDQLVPFGQFPDMLQGGVPVGAPAAHGDHLSGHSQGFDHS